jgi:putative heme iron utilization protein
MNISTIHDSLVNGQRQQMVEQINEYGLYDFWADYKRYLFEVYVDRDVDYKYFSDAVISFHRIQER